MHDITVTVPQHLKLDVPWPLNESLGINVGNAEGLLGFIVRCSECRQQFFLAANYAHPAAAASGRCFDDQWKADLLPGKLKGFFVFNDAICPGYRREAHCLHLTPCTAFSSHQSKRLRLRTNKRDMRGFAYRREIGIFRP